MHSEHYPMAGPAPLRADRGAQGVGQGLAETQDVGVVLGFDHDAGERLGAGIAEDHAPIVAEGGLGFRQGARNLGKGFEWRLGAYLYVDDGLRVILETIDQRFEPAVQGDERSNLYGGEQAVAGRRIVEENNVAGLLTAENVAAAQHFFEDVAIAVGSAGERDAFARKDPLEAEIGHGGCHHAAAVQFSLRLQIAGRGQEHSIAVHESPRFANEQGAIGIAVEGHAESGALGDHALLQSCEVQRATTGIDVAAIRCYAHGDDIGTKRAKKLRAQLVGSAIGAVQNHAEASELGAGNDAALKESKVFGVQSVIRGQGP